MEANVSNVRQVDTDKFTLQLDGRPVRVRAGLTDFDNLIAYHVTFPDGSTGNCLYDTQLDTMHDVDETMALFNVTNHLGNEYSATGSGQVGGGLKEWKNYFANNKVAMYMKGRKSKKSRMKKSMNLILLLLICASAVQYNQSTAPNYQKPTFAQAEPIVKTTEGTKISVAVVQPSDILDPIVDTGTITTFAKNLHRLTDLVPGKANRAETANVIADIPLPSIALPEDVIEDSFATTFATQTTDIPFYMNAATKSQVIDVTPDVPIRGVTTVTLENSVTQNNPVLQTLLNENALATQCVIENVLAGHVPPVTPATMKRVIEALKVEKATILNNMDSRMKKVYHQTSETMNGFVEMFDNTADKIYHASKYIYESTKMLQETLGVIADYSLHGVKGGLYAGKSIVETAAAALDATEAGVRQGQAGLYSGIVTAARTAVKAMDAAENVVGSNVRNAQRVIYDKTGIQQKKEDIADAMREALAQSTIAIAEGMNEGIAEVDKGIDDWLDGMEIVANTTYTTAKWITTDFGKLIANIHRDEQETWQHAKDVVQTLADPKSLIVAVSRLGRLLQPVGNLDFLEKKAAKIAKVHHGITMLDASQDVCKRIIEVTQKPMWAVSAASVAMDALLLPSKIEDVLGKFEKKVTHRTNKATDNIDNKLKNLKELIPGVAEVKKEHDELVKKWDRFMDNKLPLKVDSPTKDTVMGKYIQDADKGELTHEDLKVIASVADMVFLGESLNVVPLKIEDLGGQTTHFETPNTSVIVNNTPAASEEVHEPMRPYDKNDTLNPVNSIASGIQSSTGAIQTEAAQMVEQAINGMVVKPDEFLSKEDVEIPKPTVESLPPEATPLGKPIVVDPVPVPPAGSENNVNPVQTMTDSIKDAQAAQVVQNTNIKLGIPQEPGIWGRIKWTIAMIKADQNGTFKKLQEDLSKVPEKVAKDALVAAAVAGGVAVAPELFKAGVAIAAAREGLDAVAAEAIVAQVPTVANAVVNAVKEEAPKMVKMFIPIP